MDRRYFLKRLAFKLDKLPWIGSYHLYLGAGRLSFFLVFNFREYCFEEGVPMDVCCKAATAVLAEVNEHLDVIERLDFGAVLIGFQDNELHLNIRAGLVHQDEEPQELYCKKEIQTKCIQKLDASNTVP